jgi:asparagine synthase (glutamine-hydrolysing)
MTSVQARDGAAAVGLLEATFYMRNQLLRDSDWASMGHSLELRTPLVDAALLEILGPYVSGFTGGAGKGMLAQSPRKSLPGSIVNRPKTGFSLPMATWLSGAAHKRAWADLPLLAVPGTPWARRWARAVIERMTACE